MRIAFIGDLHYPSMIGKNEKVKEARDAFYAKFLHTFFEIEADYYVSIGDLTNFGREDELREVYEIIRKYDKPFIHTFGNHDLYGVSRDEVLNISNSEQNISIATDEVNIISLETARDHDHEDYSGYVNDKQLQWLEAEIAESEDKLVIIFAHHPVYDTTANSNFPYLSIQPEVPILDVLRKKKGNGIYINGHNHKDSIETIDNWTFVQANAVLDDQSIRILEINDNEISIQSPHVASPELRGMAQLIGSNINHFQLNPLGMGTTPNREKLIKRNLYV
ncbi:MULTISPECIES: metallophosphoesterase family protein [Oceanobacillus]|uniref:Metallophosphoesterase n=1 Tax=Oceanobacillus profundus TaxID=372463 RepID=A0A417YN39_9BACI|nr:metallophosphoesterase [Oceanobacillus profundus]MBR3120274.1 metallophosphoesterase [Oceanobacillus sp.]MCM3398697.1 metallophosphoesterase [Oceanobacillus profundus]RHW35107.1 metallophosphoesterase [Oceanobacillus profundus]